MTKFKVDVDKKPHEQRYWNRLKPEVKLKIQKLWKQSGPIVDEGIKNGTYIIDPSIPKRDMFVDIPDNQLTKEKK